MNDHLSGQKQDGSSRSRTPGRARGGRDLSELIVAVSADGIVAVDDHGIIRLCNNAAQELLARPAEDLIGTPFGFPVVGDRAAEVDLMLPDGAGRVVEMRAATTTLDGERLHIAALRDVTSRRQAERDLETALERQGVLLSVAAHELHSPLAAISVLAHILRDRGGMMTADERSQLVDRVIELTSRLQTLVRQLLAGASTEAAAGRSVSEPVRVLEVIVEQLIGIERKSDDVRVSCRPELTAAADRAELSIMLGNYLDNAMAYARPPIEVRAAGRDGWTEIRVSDSGPGVPDSFVPHLFEHFTRAPETEHDAEGSGLGLWIVRTFARANGGDAWHEPGENGGSAFCLRLPAICAAPVDQPGR
jgi:signal transduction histidine kinase